MILCGSKKYPYLPHGRSLEIPRGRGPQQPKFIRESVKLNWIFLGGGRVQMKKPSMGEVWIFSGTTHSQDGIIKNFHGKHFG